MTAGPATRQEKLPLWRLIAGMLVIVIMAAVLLSLAPVYFEDMQLRRYMQVLVSGSNASDETVQAAVLNRARQLDLPVLPGQVKITHPNGKLKIDIKYAVQMDFQLYQVDVHFQPTAASH